MTKTFRRHIRRSVTGSLGRYIAILLIIMLGVSFLAGLRLTRPAMTATATDYIQTQKLYDLRLLSTVGFDDADVAAIRGAAGVTNAEGSYFADFITADAEGDQIYRAHMLTETLNLPQLSAGRMPEADNECLADAGRFSPDILGQTLAVSATGDDSLLKYDGYTVVGLANVPYYLNRERGTTALGNGSLSAFLLVPKGGFDSEYYTELYVQSDNTLELYSAAHNDMTDALSDTVKPIAAQAVSTRFDKLTADANEEIADGERELADKKAEAEKELQDAEKKLLDAEAEIADGEAELLDAKAQLDSAAATLNDGAAQLQPGFSSWQGALDAGFAAYRDGQAQLDSAMAEANAVLLENKAQLDDGDAQYEIGKAQYDAALETFKGHFYAWKAGNAQFEAGLAAWQDGNAQFEAGLAAWQDGSAQLEAGLADYNGGLAQLEAEQADYAANLQAFEAIKDTLPPEQAAAQQAALDTAKATLDATAAALAAAKAELDANAATLADTKATLDATSAALAASKAELNASRATLDASKAELDAGKAELDANAEKLMQTRFILDAGRDEYEDGVRRLEAERATQQGTLNSAYQSLLQFQSGIRAYSSGLQDYNAGVASMEDGKRDYEEGKRDYEDGKKELDEQVQQGEEELLDAREKLKDLENPEIFALTRSANAGYVSFEGDSQIVQNLSALFPLFFFLIAALICSTTMTRMIDEDRAAIGTLRALGYGRTAILSKYLIYSGSAALIGCLIGYFGGGMLFPYVIWSAYGMLYNIPGFIGLYDLGLFVGSLSASMLCSAGVTFVTCRHEMLSTPADLIRPKAPTPGQRIFLERITPLWSRLKFLHKVTLRNIFRFKKRMFMMLFGIAGCTALILTGFGVRDSIANIATYQFSDIQKYDLSVTLEKPLTEKWLTALYADVNGELEAHAAAMTASGELSGPLAQKTVSVITSDDAQITDIFDLHLNGATVPYPGQGEIVLSEKLAEMAGVSIGDNVVLSVGEAEDAPLRVSGIVENYVQNYVYMTGQTYEAAFDKPYEAKTLLLRAAEDTDEYSLSAALSNRRGVASVSVISDMRRMIENMMQSLDAIVALILICAGALAFIVLFNLGNINLTERVREIATIEVLGFHMRETGSYVFRENFVLSMMGIVIGLPLGVALHAFVMGQIHVDMVSFKIAVEPVSFLLTVALVALFSVLTDFIMRRKIRHISMAESLKSVE